MNTNFQTCMFCYVHSNAIYNSQNTEAAEVSIHTGIDKEDVEYIYNVILLSYKKGMKFAFSATWMEIIILSEISQTEKYKYHILLVSGI